MPNRKPSYLTRIEKAFELTKAFEGYREKAYTDPVGVLTIGIGYAQPDVRPYHHVPRGLAEDAAKWRLFKEYINLSNLAYDQFLPRNQGLPSDRCLLAYTDLVYNVGLSAVLAGDSWQALMLGDWKEAAARFLLYTKAGGKDLPGLIRRRQAWLKFWFHGEVDLYPQRSDINPEVLERALLLGARITY